MNSLAVPSPAPLAGHVAPGDDLVALLLEDKRSEATRRAYAADLAAFFGGEPGAGTVRAFVGQSVPAIALQLAQFKARMRRDGLAEATINRRLAAVRSLLKFAHRLGCAATDGRGLVDSEKNQAYRDTRGVDLKTMRRLLALPDELFGPNGEGAPARVYKNGFFGIDGSNQVDVRAQARELRRRRDKAILHLLLENALRRCELVRATVADFEPAADVLWILGKGKGQQKTSITLSRATCLAVADYLALAGHREGALLRSLDNASAGHGLTGDGIYAIVAFYRRQAGLERLSPHRLRHSAITAALAATKRDVRRVQKLSRHAKLETLLIYDDNLEDHQGQVTGLLSDLLTDKKKRPRG